MVVFSYLLMTLLMFVGLFLIGLILLQRGRGGGLAGAFGGMGGQSAFGTKAGDVFTRITIGVATAWILLCAISVVVLHNASGNRLSEGVLKAEDKPETKKAAERENATPGQEARPSSSEAKTTPPEDKTEDKPEDKAEQKPAEKKPDPGAATDEAKKAADSKPEEKPAEAKPEEKPAEQPKPEQPKAEEPKSEQPKADQPKPAEPNKPEEPKPETPQEPKPQ